MRAAGWRSDWAGQMLRGKLMGQVLDLFPGKWVLPFSSQCPAVLRRPTVLMKPRRHAWLLQVQALLTHPTVNLVLCLGAVPAYRMMLRCVEVCDWRTVGFRSQGCDMAFPGHYFFISNLRTLTCSIFTAYLSTWAFRSGSRKDIWDSSRNAHLRVLNFVQDA